MTGKTGCGGLVRDYTGRWIFGFTKKLGTASAYMAELWGLHEGLLLARSCGVQQLEIQLDSKVVVCSLKEGKIGSASSWSLIKKIKLLLNHSRQVRITHLYGEANRCADILANIGCVFSTTTTVYT
ncbi:heat shock 70 kDa protein [Trifolium repens]|nr:heat shock 70 kDa protein [Trifolium repens]